MLFKQKWNLSRVHSTIELYKYVILLWNLIPDAHVHETDLWNERGFLGHKTTIFLLQDRFLQMTKNPHDKGMWPTKGAQISMKEI